MPKFFTGYTVICKVKQYFSSLRYVKKVKKAERTFSAPFTLQYLTKKKTTIKLPGHAGYGIWSNIMIKEQTIKTMKFDTMKSQRKLDVSSNFHHRRVVNRWSHKLIFRYDAKWLICGRQLEIWIRVYIYRIVTERHSTVRTKRWRISKENHRQTDGKMIAFRLRVIINKNCN